MIALFAVRIKQQLITLTITRKHHPSESVLFSIRIQTSDTNTEDSRRSKSPRTFEHRTRNRIQKIVSFAKLSITLVGKWQRFDAIRCWNSDFANHSKRNNCSTAAIAGRWWFSLEPIFYSALCNLDAKCWLAMLFFFLIDHNWPGFRLKWEIHPCEIRWTVHLLLFLGQRCAWWGVDQIFLFDCPFQKCFHDFTRLKRIFIYK